MRLELRIMIGRSREARSVRKRGLGGAGGVPPDFTRRVSEDRPNGWSRSVSRTDWWDKFS